MSFSPFFQKERFCNFKNDCNAVGTVNEKTRKCKERVRFFHYFQMKSFDIPVLVVGNKVDLEREVAESEVEDIQKEWGCTYLGKSRQYLYNWIERWRTYRRSGAVPT